MFKLLKSCAAFSRQHKVPCQADWFGFYCLCSINDMEYHLASNIERVFSCVNFHTDVSFLVSHQSNQCLDWCRFRNDAFMALS